VEEDVFRAIADPHRRRLLDLLFQRDGQSLSELQAHLPMTRFGVMKHLSVLEGVGLVTTAKVGRERLHYLNPVPIQEVYDRWVGKFARHVTPAITALKARLEEEAMNDTARPTSIFKTFIRTTPERLWQALTDGELTPHYYRGMRLEHSGQVGSPFRYLAGEQVITDGEILDFDPPRRLRTTFIPNFAPAMGKMIVTYEIEQQEHLCKLTLTYEGLDSSTPLGQGIAEGTQQILSGLKTYLETGEPLGIKFY
jgi:uncharacterized protein YndB with AHSA1/START domain/DNA-binding transcriptional ArsR family regulator